jgi:ribosomal protein S18 acetylase RimI-like enzyme
MTSELPIVPFRPELAGAFAELNRAWIERLFRLETADRELLEHPQKAIVERGGEVFFAVDGGRVAGTVAMILHPPGTFELGKMAVDPAYQGRGLGEALGRAAIAFARAAGADRITLETNSALANAIRLYQRLGFAHTPRPVPSEYVRADVYMELDLRHTPEP